MVTHLANFTYTNKSFTCFFSFKQDKDFLDLNQSIYITIRSNTIPDFNSLSSKGLNQKQKAYLCSFLNLYLLP